MPEYKMDINPVDIHFNHLSLDARFQSEISK